MKFAIIENGAVVNVAVGTQPLDSNWIEADASVNIGDLWDGQAFTAPPAVFDVAAIQAGIVAATQARLDTFARTRNYDGILSLCTYATSAVPKFQAEGQYGVNARDNTWATLYTIMAEVQAQTRPMPSGFADIEPDLPVLAWPN